MPRVAVMDRNQHIVASHRPSGFLSSGGRVKDMAFSSGLLGTLLSGSSAWSARITSTAFECRKGNQDTRFPFDTLTQVQCSTGLVYAVLTVSAGTTSVELRGMGNRKTRRLAAMLKQSVADSLLARLEPHRAQLKVLWKSYTAFRDAPRYLARADLEKWREIHRTRYDTVAQILGGLLRQPFLARHLASGGLLKRASILTAAMDGDTAHLEGRNEDFVRQEVEECRAFFDSIESTPLTPEQRRASVVMQDRNLLVASAGSGKTSTVVGKVGYALLRKLVAPEQILIVAFNAHAAAEIEERVHERLGPWMPEPISIKAKTFHAFGLEIIADVEGTRPSVAGGSDGDRVIGEIIDHLLETDGSFATAWVAFHSLHPNHAADPAAFPTAEAWNAYLRSTGEYEKGRYGYRTLDGGLAGTQGERAIANWLYLNGVDYVHADSDPHGAPPTNHPQAGPSFHLPQIDAYLDHRALDPDGKPPVALERDHRAYQTWRRGLSAEKVTDVIETRFSEYASGTLFPRLRKELAGREVTFRPLPRQAVLARIREVGSQQLEETSSLIQAFIKHARSSQLTPDALQARARRQPHPARAVQFVRIAARIMDRYADRHRRSGTVDFEDMILKAARYAREGRYRHGFRLILVDEFQDISQARAGLLLGLLRHAPDCKLFAVGDDWQSIYRFAGSDISLFTGFESHFGKTAVNYLTQTFRSNQGIAEAAANFVQQNSAQIRKEVVAQDPTRKATLVVRRYGRRSDTPRYVDACLAEIEQEANKTGETHSVYILGRYRRQAPEDLADWQSRYGSALEIDYKTVHSSKGLQADYVILIGLDSGGFPSERADDPLLDLVMPEPETHPHAEERRLFYVALTRARHRAYLLGSKRSPSCFLAELVDKNAVARPILRIADKLGEDVRKEGEKCPRCKVGRLVLRTGTHGPFYGCSEFPACRYTANRAH